MDRARFEQMVKRLEGEAAADAAGYTRRVALLAVAGFALLALVIGASMLILAGLAGLVITLVLTSGKLLLVLAKLGKLVVLLAIPLWVLVRSALQAVFTRFPKPEGHELQREDAPALFARLDWMRTQMHGPRFHHVLVTPEMNAAVVQRPLLGLAGVPRNYLILGLPLLETMSEAEALAVVAHEYGHLAGGHSRFGAFIYRLRLTWAHIGAVAGHWGGWGGRFIGGILGRFAPYFNAYTFVLARQNEFAADAAAARLVGADPARAALKRVNIGAGHYAKHLESVYARAVSEPVPPADAMGTWSGAIRAAGADSHRSVQFLHASLARETDYADTHPALGDRLGALGLERAAAPELPQPIAESATAAAVWFGARAGAIRAAVQSHWQDGVREAWVRRHAEAKAQQERLAALESIETRNQDEDRERIALMRATGRDALGEVEAFLERYPADPRAHFIRGAILIEREDQRGIESLERAMQGDSDSIIAACSMIYEFLIDRDRARALQYLDRIDARTKILAACVKEFDDARAVHALQPAALPEDKRAWFVDQIRVAIAPVAKSIVAVYLVRRVLPADPSLETYLLAVETRWIGRQRGHGRRAVQAIAAIPFERPIVYVELTGDDAALTGRIKALAGAAIVL